ncbi:MAG: TolC family protein [Spirochaetaceae bacterium]|jgi:outer membrane protein TolC|nr:TolC family protein [Spirochaetaceae bacterium]
MKTKSFLVIVLVFAALHFLSAETVLTVDDAAVLALKHNLGLERTRIETEGKKREAGNAWNSLIPSLSAGASYGRGASLTGDLTPGREKWTPGVSLSAAVSLSPAMVSEIQRAKADYEAGLLSYEAAKQELELQVRKSFYQILLLQGNVELADRNMTSAQARYEEAAAKARAGQAARLDERSAKVELENLRPAKRNAETLLRNALENFALILGMNSGETIRLDGSLETAAPVVSVLDDINGTIKKQDSFSTASLRKSQTALEAQRKTLRNQVYIPSLHLSWTGNPAYANEAWTDSAGSFSIGVNIQLENFFPASKSRNQIAALDDNLTLYRIQITEALKSEDITVRQNMRALEQSAESIEALSLNVDLARETYAMWEESYRQGSADLQQLRNAADSLSEAENRMHQEQYNLLAAMLDLEKTLNVPFGTLKEYKEE